MYYLVAGCSEACSWLCIQHRVKAYALPALHETCFCASTRIEEGGENRLGGIVLASSPCLEEQIATMEIASQISQIGTSIQHDA